MQTDRLKGFIISKLVGAGFSFALIIFLYVFFYRLTLFDLSETLSTPWLWVAFYIYAILWSALTDWLMKVYAPIRRFEWIIYILGGVVIFAIIQFHFVYILIAGSIGALAAIFFYLGKTYLTRFISTTLIFALMIPILFYTLTLFDFTKKRDWEEMTTETSYSVNFSYFNGEHRLPMPLEKGDKLTFSVDCVTDDGWGYHMKDRQNNYLPLTEESRRDQLSFVAEETETYYIVLRGSRASGECVVDWQID